MQIRVTSQVARPPEAVLVARALFVSSPDGATLMANAAGAAISAESATAIRPVTAITARRIRFIVVPFPSMKANGAIVNRSRRHSHTRVVVFSGDPAGPMIRSEKGRNHG